MSNIALSLQICFPSPVSFLKIQLNIALKKGNEFGWQETKDEWIVGVEVLPVPSNETHVMADAPHVIYVEDTYSTGNNV